MIKKKNMLFGARIFMGIFVLLFFLLVVRIVHIQVTKEVQGETLMEIAEEKWKKERVIEAHRGRILDKNGMTIAVDVPSYTAYAILDEDHSKNSKEPRHVTDPLETAQKLAPILEMDETVLFKLLSKDAFQVEMGSGGRNINPQKKEEIESLGLPGIGFLREMKRSYPNGIFASHAVGYVKRGENEIDVGEMGIEHDLDDLLKGADGYVTYQSDRKGIRLPDPKEMVTPPLQGHDIYLTIDQKIQTFLERALTHIDQEYEPEKMIAIVADPKTGEILAMGNRPSFDPNIRNITNYWNDAISYPFEPGSTMKVFTLAAAINENEFNEDEIFQSGTYQLPKVRPIRDHNNGKGWGQISYLEGVQRSSNVAFSIIANEKLGTSRLHQYLLKFGFDKKTGIDLPNEMNGEILYRYPVEKVNTAFGQGTTITPIQQIQAFSSIANDGQMMKPYIVKKIVDPQSDETVQEGKPTVVGEPVSVQTASKVRDILETVVTSPNGTGKRYAIEGYSVAGKTGTAQIPNRETGGYLTGHGNNIFSFLGMAPKDDPELIMYIAVEKPKLKSYELGSEPGSYIFRTVMKNSLHYLQVKPENLEEVSSISENDDGVELENFSGKHISDVVRDAENKGLEVVVLGSGKRVEGQLPYMGERILPGEKLFIKSNGTVAMPDMTDWSLRDVLKLCEIMSLNPNIFGKGYVINQNITPGIKVKQGDYLVVDLEPPFVPIESEDKEKTEEDEVQE